MVKKKYICREAISLWSVAERTQHCPMRILAALLARSKMGRFSGKIGQYPWDQLPILLRAESPMSARKLRCILVGNMVVGMVGDFDG